MAVFFVVMAVGDPYNGRKGDNLMNTLNNQSTLHHVLHTNAVFSFTSGLFFVLARQPLTEFLGASAAVMNILALVMFGYALLIAANILRPEIHRNFVLFTIIGDSAWVLASILLLILPAFSFSSDAKWAIGITAICVDILATLQFLQWRKMP
jgi:hypothetical protein